MPPAPNGLEPFRHLYLHIPFCRHKCGYCDFNAYAGMDRLMPQYVAALIAELEHARATHRFEGLRTVYLGGGTPSLLAPSLMGELLESVYRIFDVEAAAEVTLEANPASTDIEKLTTWRRLGVNRLSLGVQGFDPRALAVLERRTDGAQAVRAFHDARAAGFDNLNLDLIFAVPFQGRTSWRTTLERATALEPEHLSCYALTIEEGTLLDRRVREGRLPTVEEDVQWDLLDLTSEVLAERGYRRYEVSNWARPGRESRHNLAYWHCRPVFGAGAGAHSYATDGNRAWRWWNVRHPRAYVSDAPLVVDGGEELDPRRARAEAMMMGLRTAAGIAPAPGFDGEIASLEAAGLVTRERELVAPTRRGLDLHNQVALAVL